MSNDSNRRILVVDDTEAIHTDFRKILEGRPGASAEADRAADDFFGPRDGAPAPAPLEQARYEVATARQGPEALEMVKASIQRRAPYALVFLDVRMPPGWDGVDTLRRLWSVDPHLQAVICTAFSDYSYEQTVELLGRTDRFLILKKPFDPIEVQQIAAAMVEKWNTSAREHSHLAAVKRAEQEARAFAASLETVNRALSSDRAVAQAYCESRADLLCRAGASLRGPAERIESGLALSNARPAAGHEAEFGELERAVGDLGALARDLADLGASEAGRLELSTAPCAVVDLLRAATASADCGPVELVLDASVVSTVDVDPARAGQVLRAIVRAARALAKNRSVVLRASSTRAGGRAARGLCVELSVAGEVLTADVQNRLFEPFGMPGADLSLPVSRRLARAMGGDLTVESDASYGTRFWLVLGV